MEGATMYPRKASHLLPPVSISSVHASLEDRHGKECFSVDGKAG